MKILNKKKASRLLIAASICTLMNANLSQGLPVEKVIFDDPGYMCDVANSNGAIINKIDNSNAQIKFADPTRRNYTVYFNHFNIPQNKSIDCNFSANGQVGLIKANLGLSKIAGTLSSSGADGRIILSNPNGIMFESGSYINANSFMATTHDVTLDANKINLDRVSDNAVVVNDSTMRLDSDLVIASAGIKIDSSDLFAGNISLVSSDGATFIASDADSKLTPENNIASATNLTVDPTQVNYADGSSSASNITINGASSANSAIKASDGKIYMIASGDNSSIAINDLTRIEAETNDPFSMSPKENYQVNINTDKLVLNDSNGIRSQGNININSNDIDIDGQGSWTSNNTIINTDSFDVSGQNINNRYEINSRENLIVNASKDININQAARLSAGKNLTLNTQEDVNISGLVGTGNSHSATLAINAKNINVNSKGGLKTFNKSGNVDTMILNASEDLKLNYMVYNRGGHLIFNANNIYTDSTPGVDSQTIRATNGATGKAKTLTMNATNNLQFGKATVTDKVTLKGKNIYSDKDASSYGSYISCYGDIEVEATNNIDLSEKGALKANKKISIKGADVKNTSDFLIDGRYGISVDSENANLTNLKSLNTIYVKGTKSVEVKDTQSKNNTTLESEWLKDIKYENADAKEVILVGKEYVAPTPEEPVTENPNLSDNNETQKSLMANNSPLLSYNEYSEGENINTQFQQNIKSFAAKNEDRSLTGKIVKILKGFKILEMI